MLGTTLYIEHTRLPIRVITHRPQDHTVDLPNEVYILTVSETLESLCDISTVFIS